jgi:hypothetical protein
MTATEQNLPIAPATAPAVAEHAFEPCDSCQAPLDERQRYCVVCGAHRANADDPVARYLAAARRARTAPAPSSQGPSRPIGGGRLAVAIALVPLAAALGVLVGRGDSSGNEQVIKALKVQKAPVVNVVPTGATATTGGAATTTAAASTGKSAAGTSTASSGKVLARTKYGTAKKLEGSKITKAEIVQSKKALKQISSTKGKAYVESQKNLPDTIVIP